MFEWDEAKRSATIDKHGIDFADLADFFDQPLMLRQARSETEDRYLAVGYLGPTIIAVVYTMRGDRRRIITARRARDNERQDFRALHGR